MVEVFRNSAELSEKAAVIFCKTAQEAVQKKGRFTVALTGGTSPAKLYELLSLSPYKESVPWDRTYVFWGDERWVPLSDEKSNAKMAFETLLSHVPVPKNQIFTMWGEAKPEVFDLKYEEQLREYLGDTPQFDLILLGMGDDGHTASLFPGTNVLHEQKRLVKAYYLSPQSMYRITLTALCINAAKKIIFLVLGEKKAPALHQVLEGAYNPTEYPAQLIKPENGEVFWLADELAAQQLKAV